MRRSCFRFCSCCFWQCRCWRAAAVRTTAGDDSQETVENKVSAIVNVAALNGPTGMGMVKLMDLTDKYAVTTYQAPTDIAPKLINGEVDVAALPSNMAAVLYNKTEGQIVAVSPDCAGCALYARK